MLPQLAGPVKMGFIGRLHSILGSFLIKRKAINRYQCLLGCSQVSPLKIKRNDEIDQFSNRFGFGFYKQLF
jgi:hypothetical protein